MTAELDTDGAQRLPRDAMDAECIFCTGLCSVDKDSENWKGCGICFKWSHTLCANFEGEVFVSDTCK
jgi:hypothetical protein